MSDRHLVQLDADHPGFRDAAYRARRDALAALAREHREGEPVPDVRYTAGEEAVWRAVWHQLRPLHAAHVHSDLQALQAELGLADGALPQLSAVNRALQASGFRMEPVAGLVVPRDFLEALGRGIFLSTQYMRHPSRPLYTPEPDLVHELVGHAASLRHPAIAALSRDFGRTASMVDDDVVERIVRVYWWTLEFGLVREDRRVRALGAGLLSSAGELAASVDVRRERWSVEAMARMPYDPTRPNPQLFVAPSIDALVADVRAWLRTEVRGRRAA